MRRFSTVLLIIALAAAACSSSEDQVADSGPGDELASGAAETTTDQPADASTSQTTFVPPLEGPFDTSGGAQRGEPADLIVDDTVPDSLPAPLSAYTSWPTDWSRRTVEDWSEFQAGLSGSDPRDGIPPIDTPVFETVDAAAEWLDPREPGALVQLDEEVRFYPLGILTRHEIVNDAIGDVPIAVTYCPLCNTALAFDRRVDGQVLRFGVSGLLRNSDLVMWDQATTSLWQQITGEGVVGEFAGTQLDVIPASIVSFEQFRSEFPDGLSLAAESGAGRGRYGRNPYRGYSTSDRPFLFGGEIDDRLPALARVVGLVGTEPARAYSFDLLEQVGVVNDDVGGTAVAVFWGGDTADALDEGTIADSDSIGSAIAFDPVVEGERLRFAAGEVDGTFVDDQTGSTWSILGLATNGELAGTRLETLPHRNEFWFAWQAFFGPDTLSKAG